MRKEIALAKSVKRALIGQVRGPVGSCMRVGKKVCRKVHMDLG